MIKVYVLLEIDCLLEPITEVQGVYKNKKNAEEVGQTLKEVNDYCTYEVQEFEVINND